MFINIQHILLSKLLILSMFFAQFYFYFISITFFSFSSNVSRQQKTQYFWKPKKSKREIWFLFWGCFGLDKKKFLPKLFWFLLALTILFLFHCNNWCWIFSSSETRIFAHEHGGLVSCDYKNLFTLYISTSCIHTIYSDLKNPKLLTSIQETELKNLNLQYSMLKKKKSQNTNYYQKRNETPIILNQMNFFFFFFFNSCIELELLKTKISFWFTNENILFPLSIS